MMNGRVREVCRKTYFTPRRFGIRDKRELWRVEWTLAKTRKAAHDLPTRGEKYPVRLFDGNALLSAG